jgi:hypothetical protein
MNSAQNSATPKYTFAVFSLRGSLLFKASLLFNRKKVLRQTKIPITEKINKAITALKSDCFNSNL